jgi:hypothetical protein
MTIVCEILVFPIQIHKRLLSQPYLKFEGNQNIPIVLQTEMIASSIERYCSFFNALPQSSKHAARNGGINSVCQELSDRFIAELIDAEEKGTSNARPMIGKPFPKTAKRSFVRTTHVCSLMERLKDSRKANWFAPESI